MTNRFVQRNFFLGSAAAICSELGEPSSTHHFHTRLGCEPMQKTAEKMVMVFS
jgi:hypothetical protein